MTMSWQPSLNELLAESSELGPHEWLPFDEPDVDEDELMREALDGDVEALEKLRWLTSQIDYDELGWGD